MDDRELKATLPHLFRDKVDIDILAEITELNYIQFKVTPSKENVSGFTLTDNPALHGLIEPEIILDEHTGQEEMIARISLNNYATLLHYLKDNPIIPT